MDTSEKVKIEMDELERMVNNSLSILKKDNPKFIITPSLVQHPTYEGHKWVLYLKAEVKNEPPPVNTNLLNPFPVGKGKGFI